MHRLWIRACICVLLECMNLPWSLLSIAAYQRMIINWESWSKSVLDKEIRYIIIVVKTRGWCTVKIQSKFAHSILDISNLDYSKCLLKSV